MIGDAPNLADLMDIGSLEVEIQDGYVRERRHPTLPLTIFNYTEKAQFEKHWNAVTRQCRGLIVRNDTDEVVARPFPKFFNYGEHPAGSLDLEHPARVIDKLDGSLGILYPEGYTWSLATRGSFESEQAHEGTIRLREHVASGWQPLPGITYLFEIIYPENRIVVDYGDLFEVVLLGGVAIGDGAVYGPGFDPDWPGMIAGYLPATTLGEALALEPRDNAEGIVVTMLRDHTMVKIKQEDYVALHRLVTGLNERVVWEYLSTHDGRYEGLLADLPEEFEDWVVTRAEGLLDDFEILQGRAHGAYHDALFRLKHTGHDGDDEREYRKAFAKEAHLYGDLAPLLFQLLDGRDIAPAIWKTLKPKGQTQSALQRSEDNA